MPVVRTFDNLISANVAAQALRAGGVPARISSPPDLLRMGFALEVDADSLSVARAVLAEFERDRPVPVSGWEDETTPDLGALAPELAPPCPRCSKVLPLDAGLGRCPGCGGAVDVTELLIARHGPEVLASLFGTGDGGLDEMLDEDVLDQSPLSCRGCRYPLRGLPAEGVCPECGRGYSKRDLIRGE